MTQPGILIGRHSDPVSQGARHHCDGEYCAFCYTKKQCDVCNGRGCRICVLVAENINKLDKLGAISLKDLKQEKERLTTSPLSSKTDRRTNEPASSSVDSTDE